MTTERPTNCSGLEVLRRGAPQRCVRVHDVFNTPILCIFPPGRDAPPSLCWCHVASTKPDQFLSGVPERFPFPSPYSSITHLIPSVARSNADISVGSKKLFLREFYRPAFFKLSRDDNHLNVWFDNNPRRDAKPCADKSWLAATPVPFISISCLFWL